MNKRFKKEGQDNNILVSEWQKTKDMRILDELVANHYSIIYSIVNHYNKTGFNKNDLWAEGVLGILTAMEKFDAHQNVKFTTYAYFWIKARIIKFIKQANPFLVNKKLSKIDPNKEVNCNIDENDINDDLLDDLEETDADTEDYDERKHDHFEDMDEFMSQPIMRSKNKIMSMDTEGQEIHWTNFIGAKAELEEELIEDDFSELLKVCMLSLSKIKQNVLEKRWLCGKKVTFEDLALEFKLSPERIRQIEKEALSDIRVILTTKFGSLRGEMIVSMAVFKSIKKNK